MTTIIIIAYALIALVWGYLVGRHTWRKGASDVEPYSLSWSLSTWLLFGTLWPLTLGLYVVAVVYDWSLKHEFPCAKRLGHRLFGS